MSPSKRHQRGLKNPPQLRTRTLRSSKGKLLSDPAENTQQLTNQLRQLGLYAANTLGDGNCLFRALSDQLYGTESHHTQLRRDICDWIDKHHARYEPFVEDERGIDVHLRLMRQPATYGGHLEISAFAHMARRDVKVIQPGLVYVIEWASGWDSPTLPAASPSYSTAPVESQDDRSRRSRREKKRVEKEKVVKRPPDDGTDDDSDTGPIYVAYHDWEHFSSIRNLRGPHQGIPHVREMLAVDVDDLPPPPNPKSKPHSKARASKTSSKARLSTPAPPTPSQIPLPPSRSISPEPEPTSSRRSPKRSFDESSGSSQASESAAKRSRPNEDMDIDEGGDDDDDTPGLSETFSTASSTSSSPPPPAAPVERPLTRRQRKLLGMPKPRSPVVVGRSAGKIVIPGGRYRRPSTARKEAARDEKDTDGDEEWTRNGVGRVDVRGFRELRI